MARWVQTATPSGAGAEAGVDPSTIRRKRDGLHWTDWEIAADEMRLWVLAHELAGHTLLSVPHIADRLRTLVQRHVGAFRADSSAMTDKLSSLDMDQSDPMAAMQAAFGDPEVLLGAVDTIARCRPVVVFEWEEHLACSHSRTLAQTQQTLTELGYRLEILRDYNGLGKQVDYVGMPVG